MVTVPDLSQNRHLAAMRAEERVCLFPHLELIGLPLGQAISESDVPTTYAYFPTMAIISLLYVIEDGVSAEIAVVGNGGIVGVCIFMGGKSMKSRAVVQSAGYAYRLKRQVLKDEFSRAASLRVLLLRYTQALISQTHRL